MANPASNTSTRPMLNTMNEDRMGIVYRAKISEKYKLYLKILGICSPCSCLYCKADTIYQSTYVQVLENHLEWNYPNRTIMRCCLYGCHSVVPDSIDGVFYDKNLIRNVGRAGTCSPIIEMCCCPTYCDACGEAVVIYGCGCPFCCRRWKCLPYLEDADALVEQIKAAKALRENGGGNIEAPPGAIQMTEFPQQN